MKLFYFTEKIKILTLQNITFDVIRDRVMSSKLQNVIKYSLIVLFLMFNLLITSLNFKLLSATYFSLITFTVIYYTY